ERGDRKRRRPVDAPAKRQRLRLADAPQRIAGPDDGVLATTGDELDATTERQRELHARERIARPLRRVEQVAVGTGRSRDATVLHIEGDAVEHWGADHRSRQPTANAPPGALRGRREAPR